MTSIGTVGFIGVGEIAEALVGGLLQGDSGDVAAGTVDTVDAVILSPRSAARSAALAEKFGRAHVASSNAEVVDTADTVFVSVRPDQLTRALDGVNFRDDQIVISTLAGVDLVALRAVIGDRPAVVRAVPLPPVSRRAGVTPLIPAEPRAVALFDLLGGHLAVADEDQMATVTVLTGAQTGLLQYVAVLCDWAAARGLDPVSSEMFIRNTVAGLEPGLRDATTPVGGLIDAFETPGGLNWQLRTGFFDDATTGALTRELDALDARVRGE